MAHTSFDYAFTVRLHDIDGAGIVFFAGIARHYRPTPIYEALLAHLGHSIAGYIVEGKYIIPIGSVEADYKRPLRQGETITARVSIMEMSGSSYRVRIRLWGPAEDLRAEIRMRCVAVLRATMRPTAIPPDLRQALTAFLESPAA